DASSLNNYYQYFTSFNLKNYNSSEKHFFSLPSDENFPKLNAEQNIVLSQIGVIPRVPTQLIEAICYFFIFLLLFWGYWRKKWFHYKGLIFGLFLALNFGARFFIEFYKENQTLTAESLLNMGQLLSIPAVIAGIFFIVRSLSNKSQLSNG
ncbi:MAG: prolipoprotein diacylglyceryl transferase family protein, partial [Bacteroidota bacterium]|nr:prolipoprotein diacylglyceryl transferase family protein [Bacteroidota bacterium]